MKLTNFAYALAALGLFAAVPPALASTLASTYVSAAGSDSSDCDVTAPCQSFARAITQTASGGVLHCLDSNNYTTTPLTLVQSITIDCSNTTADAGSFVINGASAIVHIKGLTLGSTQGIIFQSGTALYVENCDISESGLNGILFEPQSTAELFISNSTIHNNGIGGTLAGIYIQPSFGVQVTVTIANSRIYDNNFGIVADSTMGGIIRGVVKDSVVSDSPHNGITVSTTGESDVLMIDSTAVSGNFHGLVAGGNGAGMLVRNTSVFNNTAGLYTTNGGTLYSYGNNSVNGNNGNDGTFTGTVGQQ
jgi:hypothetical protein